MGVFGHYPILLNTLFIFNPTLALNFIVYNLDHLVSEQQNQSHANKD